FPTRMTLLTERLMARLPGVRARPCPRPPARRTAAVALRRDVEEARGAAEWRVGARLSENVQQPRGNGQHGLPSAGAVERADPIDAEDVVDEAEAETGAGTDPVRGRGGPGCGERGWVAQRRPAGRGDGAEPDPGADEAVRRLDVGECEAVAGERSGRKAGERAGPAEEEQALCGSVAQDPPDGAAGAQICGAVRGADVRVRLEDGAEVRAIEGAGLDVERSAPTAGAARGRGAT